ncbi:MAG: hypothetical protein PUP92_03200 [Rhizonema sp. PD38]|nr:hypothetical protein [Rhizonema sp. PD38]
MGRLIAITENRSVRVYDMKYIVNKLEEDKALLDVPTLLFFRNDWIEDSKSYYNSHNDTKKAEFRKAIQILESTPICVDEKFVEPVEWDLEIEADILLDLNIYNGRAYIGTNKGLYHLDLNWEQENVEPIGKAQKRLDAKCVHTTAKYGTVNASCGSEGWFSFLDDFGLASNSSHKEKYSSEWSLRTAWLEFDIVNYSTTVSPNLFKSIRSSLPEEESESTNNFEKENWIVTDIGKEEVNLNSLFSEVNYKNFEPDDLQFVYNSSQTLFLNTYKGDMFALGLKKGSVNTPTISYFKRYEGLESLISSIHTIKVGNGPGLIMETDEKIILFAHKSFIPILNSEVISIRTFSRSRHYQNIVSITTANEILLIAIFDEEGY